MLLTLTLALTTSFAVQAVLGQDDWTCKTVELLEGTRGKIFCLPRTGIPFGIKWSKGVESITNGTEYLVENDGLVILEVKRSHVGSYRVKWTDPDSGSESLKDATVKVIAPAVFSTPRYTIVANEGDNVTIEMKVDGLPTPSCRWYDKKANPLKDGDSILVRDCSLHLLPVKDSDDGMFTCIATNKLGTAIGSATLTVEGKHASANPPQPLHSVQLASVTSKTLSIHVEVPGTGEPITSIHCIYSVLDRIKLPNERSIVWPVGPGRNTFTLQDLREGFVYRVHCASIGIDHLRSEWSSHLDVKLAAPTPEIWIQVLSKDNLRFTWDVPMDNSLYEGNEIIEYQLSYKTVNRIRSQWVDSISSCPVLVTIQSCGSRIWDIFQPGNRYYTAKVRTRNQGGWSQWSQEITFGGASF